MGGYTGSLSLFAGLNIIAWVLCFLFVPETKGRTLEELRLIFDIPTKDHIKYRVKFVGPWLAKRYLRPWNKVHQRARPELSDDFVEFHDWYRMMQRQRPRQHSGGILHVVRLLAPYLCGAKNNECEEEPTVTGLSSTSAGKHRGKSKGPGLEEKLVAQTGLIAELRETIAAKDTELNALRERIAVESRGGIE
ncbi:hypothetical protein DL764_000297 [Monosporascus ibericus]|uniref:Major facilitator superfamily (MFS) profile domain-containing protein n=1 Tax=Monosporascus ibericus TaxID=155417 RepID=A0A4Q4TZ80_9PEZI|nr:hypothetical protein DL764_000297 [Monosporascus ibericus]